MTTLMQARHEWIKRPADQRYASLTAMLTRMEQIRQQSRAVVVPSRKLTAVPTADNRGLEIHGPNGHGYEPTHFSFGQLASLAGAPAAYLRDLPSPLAADNLNWGLSHVRDIEDVGVLLRREPAVENGVAMSPGAVPMVNSLTAATGPRYGRIWNAEIVQHLVDRVGDGVSGSWRVPGEFGKAVTVDERNTTLYASDRDMFVFLADEERRIELPNRRDGRTGSLARGFFVSNSEVGAASLQICGFLFDYVCQNRIVWGAEQVETLRIRHNSGAPERWLEEALPAIDAYAQGSANGVVAAIERARETKLDDVNKFLANRWGAKMAASLKAVHLADEDRPIETLWDVTTAVTAYARAIPHQDRRVELEREAGQLLGKIAA